ncbi:MAG: hypothetical protein M3Q16_09015 [Pseudomonadota bacterium]|nr:hypothetical protein [Pseudomonadota bacterium]
MFKKNHSPHTRSLENEVILAVVVLYLLLAVVMTVVHYIQPAEQETVTSSTSPSHSEKNFGEPKNE